MFKNQKNNLIPAIVILAAALGSSNSGAQESTLEEQANENQVDSQYQVDSRYDVTGVVRTHYRSGEIVDCVDIYRQPAMMATATSGQSSQLATSVPPIQLAPNTLPIPDTIGLFADGNQALSLSSVPQRAVEAIPLGPGYDCPDGSVPIIRRSQAQLTKSKIISKQRKGRQVAEMSMTTGGDQLISLPRDGATDFHQYVGVRKTVDNFGAESDLNLWAPYVQRTDEFSLSQINVAGGGYGSNRETVELGWQKYYDLYGDWKTHTFVYFTPDNYGSGGCYNLDCVGFVQVNNTYPVGGSWGVSTRDGTQYYARMFLFKDGTNGHWWVQIGGIWIGYWPRSLFDTNGLADNASRFSYYGEIINSNIGGHTRTDMGSGQFANRGFGQAAWQKRLRYVDLNFVSHESKNTSDNVTDANCYSLKKVSSSDPNWQQYFYFGGSGYNTNCQ